MSQATATQPSEAATPACGGRNGFWQPSAVYYKGVRRSNSVLSQEQARWQEWSRSGPSPRSPTAARLSTCGLSTVSSCSSCTAPADAPHGEEAALLVSVPGWGGPAHGEDRGGKDVTTLHLRGGLCCRSWRAACWACNGKTFNRESKPERTGHYGVSSPSPLSQPGPERPLLPLHPSQAATKSADLPKKDPIPRQPVRKLSKGDYTEMRTSPEEESDEARGQQGLHLGGWPLPRVLQAQSALRPGQISRGCDRLRRS